MKRSTEKKYGKEGRYEGTIITDGTNKRLNKQLYTSINIIKINLYKFVSTVTKSVDISQWKKIGV